MGAILIVVWLLVVPVGVFAAGFVVALATGRAYSTGDDGDPPTELAGETPID